MKKFLIQMLVMAAIAIWTAVITLPDDKLHVVFCDVGQGDATLITYKTQQILIDAGPNDRILECLNNHLPFYDRTLEAVIVTHLQKDHNGGVRYISERYNVIKFEPVLTKGDLLAVGQMKMEVLWPDPQVLEMNTLGKENEEGIVGEISWKNFKLLLTADVSTDNYDGQEKVTVFKVPHHGSKYALDKDWLKKTRPQLAIISVGKNNYGHPAPEVVQMLDDLDIDYYRTDRDGEIEIVTDGITYSVKTDN